MPPPTECESYQELKESLELIFKAVVMGQVRPQIHVRNNTQVGFAVVITFFSDCITYFFVSWVIVMRGIRKYNP